MLGVIHDSDREARQRLQPMVDYVKGELSESGIEDVLIVVAADRHAMTELLRVGRVDWVSETVFNAIALEQSGFADIAARTWRNGTASYRSVFVVRQDSTIDSLANLHGNSIAFEHAASTSGFFVPAVTLLNANQQLCRLAHPLGSANPDCVGFVFSKRAFNTTAWVHKGITQIGVFSSDDWGSQAQVPDVLKADLRILHETPAFPRGIELFRRDMDADLRQRLLTALLEMHLDPAAESALSHYYNTRKFEIIGEQDQITLDELRASSALFERSMSAAEL